MTSDSALWAMLSTTLMLPVSFVRSFQTLVAWGRCHFYLFFIGNYLIILCQRVAAHIDSIHLHMGFYSSHCPAAQVPQILCNLPSLLQHPFFRSLHTQTYTHIILLRYRSRNRGRTLSTVHYPIARGYKVLFRTQ